MGSEQAGRGIELPHPGDDGEEHVLALAASEQIELGEDDAVGDGDLFHGFGMGIEGCHAVQAINDGDDALEAGAGEKPVVAHQGVKHGGRIGKARSFNDDAIKGLEAARGPPVEKAVQGVDEVTADGAAEAARRQFDNRLVALFDKQVIDADFAEFIDDDAGVGEEGILEQRIEQRGLAGPEKAGDDRDGDQGGAAHAFLLMRASGH